MKRHRRQRGITMTDLIWMVIGMLIAVAMIEIASRL